MAGGGRRWRQKRWWISAAILTLLIVLDLVAALVLPQRVIPSASNKFTEVDRLKSIADLRGSILSLLTPVVALVAGGAALLNFLETRRQNERTYESTQRQFALASDQFAES